MGRGHLVPIENAVIPDQYRILSYEGYWGRVMDIKAEKNHLTVNQLWMYIEDELSKFGMKRYTTFISFKTTYYKFIRSKRSSK